MWFFSAIIVMVIIVLTNYKWLSDKAKEWNENLSEEKRMRLDTIKCYLSKAIWTLCFVFFALNQFYREEPNYWVLTGCLLVGMLPWFYIGYSLIKSKMKSKKYRNTWDTIDVSLKSIGCLVNYYDSVIVANYRGLNFDFHFHSVNPEQVLVRFPCWGKIKQGDENLESIKKAINEINENTHADILMTEPDEDGDIMLMTNDEILLNSKLTNYGEYFRSIFQYLHNVSGSLIERYPMLREDENSYRPRVGFTTGNE